MCEPLCGYSRGPVSRLKRDRALGLSIPVKILVGYSRALQEGGSEW